MREIVLVVWEGSAKIRWFFGVVVEGVKGRRAEHRDAERGQANMTGRLSSSCTLNGEAHAAIILVL